MEAFREVGASSSQKRRKCSKSPWTREEDALLIKLVQTNGPRIWESIAAHIPGRTGRSCRLRWGNQLNPNIDKSPFSEEDQQRLLVLHQQYGNRWSTIANFFPGRTDNQVKNQYHVLVGSRYRKSLNSSSPRGTLDEGSVGLSRYGVESSFAVGSLFSTANNFADHSGDGGKMPIPVGGSSSVHGRDESWFVTHCSNSFDSGTVEGMYVDGRTGHGDSMMSDANTALIARLGSMAQPQEGGDVSDGHFIDFLGVGTSD